MHGRMFLFEDTRGPLLIKPFEEPSHGQNEVLACFLSGVNELSCRLQTGS